MYLIVLFILFFNKEDELTKVSFLEEVNIIRTEGCICGDTYYKPTGMLIWNKTLENIALEHSKDMQINNYFSHDSKYNGTSADRLKKGGYNYRSYAENLFFAKGYSPTAKEVVQAWKKSTSHCKNMMNTSVTEMGVGIFKGYYTQLFGSKYAN